MVATPEIRKKRKRGLDTASRDNNERPAPQSTQAFDSEAGAGQEASKATTDNETGSPGVVATTMAAEAGVSKRGKRVKSVKLRV